MVKGLAEDNINRGLDDRKLSKKDKYKQSVTTNKLTSFNKIPDLI